MASTRAGFLSLPLEIRDAIYAELLCIDEFDILVRSSEWKLHLDILRVNKQISGEASRVLLTQNDFIVVSGVSTQIAAS